MTPARTYKGWVGLSVILLLMAAAYTLGVQDYANLQTLQDYQQEMAGFVARHPVLSIGLFMAAYAVSVALSLPIATLLTLLAGFLFGKWFGTLYVVLAATAGATAIFLIARSSLGPFLREKAGKFYSRVEDNMRDNAAGYLLFMRLVPIFPFFAVNILPALFNVPLLTYLWTTFFGIIPGSFIYVNVGETLGEISSLKDLVSTKSLITFSLLGLFALSPTLYRQFKKKKKAQSHDDTP